MSPHPHCSLRVFSAPLFPVTSSTSFRDMFTRHQRCCGSAPIPRDDVGRFALLRVSQRRSLHGGSLGLVRCPAGPPHCARGLSPGVMPRPSQMLCPLMSRGSQPPAQSPRARAPWSYSSGTGPGVQRAASCHLKERVAPGAPGPRFRATDRPALRERQQNGKEGDRTVWPSLPGRRRGQKSRTKVSTLGTLSRGPPGLLSTPQGQMHPEIAPSCSPDSHRKGFPTVCSFAERSHSPTSGTCRRGERMEDVPLTAHGRGRRHVCLEHGCISSAQGPGAAGSSLSTEHRSLKRHHFPPFPSLVDVYSHGVQTPPSSDPKERVCRQILSRDTYHPRN